MEINSCRKTFPSQYIRVTAFDATRGVESPTMSYIVNRPKKEPGFGLVRQEVDGRAIRYTIHSYATDKPPKANATDRFWPHARRPAGTRRRAAFDARQTGWTVDDAKTVDLQAIVRDSNVTEVLDQLDRELVGLAPVKRRIREIAAYLAVTRARKALGLEATPPSLHMCFTGNPGTGKTTVALRMAEILHRLGYVRKGHVVSVTRDDLVGQYIGHTAPKTKEVLKKAMGGVLFIDEAYYLYRPENERDYGQESIEILLQVMENNRDDLVVILAGYKDRMNTFFSSNPGMSSRIAHHIDFPDYSQPELLSIASQAWSTR